MRSLLAPTLAIGLLAAASPAFADDSPTPAPSGGAVEKPAPAPFREPALLLAVRLGPSFPQAFNKLDTNFVLDVELALQLPFFHRRFGLFLDGSFSQPTASGTKQSAQIGASGGQGDMVGYTLTQRDFGVTLGVQYLHFVKQRVGLYLGVGAKVHFTRDIVDQHAGSVDLGTNTEDSSRIGVIARAGLGIKLGPGMLVIELHYEHAPVKQLVTGDDNTADLAAQLGYAFFLR
jgi:hypothetical protein